MNNIDESLFSHWNFIHNRIFSVTTLTAFFIWLIYCYCLKFYDFNFIEKATVYNSIFALIINKN